MMKKYHFSKLASDPRALLNLVVFGSLGISLLLLFLRILFTGKFTFVFLGWNLVLAAVPFVISDWLSRKKMISTLGLIGALGLWLVFFPNAPYIFTDFMHLRHRPEAPFWFDLSLLTIFAWLGLMVGYISLMQMHNLLARVFSSGVGWFFSILTLVLSGFGVYLGRFLRWNSWDILRSPGDLFADIFHSLSHPFSEPRAWGVTMVFGAFLCMGYLLLRAMIFAAKEEPQKLVFPGTDDKA